MKIVSIDFASDSRFVDHAHGYSRPETIDVTIRAKMTGKEFETMMARYRAGQDEPVAPPCFRPKTPPELPPKGDA